MIEAIKEIGKKILENKSGQLLDNLIREDLPTEIKDKKQHLMIINYKIFDKAIDIDFEEIKDDTAQRYLWIGDAVGNAPQIYFTTKNLKYLLSQTIVNMIEKTPRKKELYNLLCLVRDEMFMDLGFLLRRNRYLLNWEKVKIFDKKIDIFTSPDGGLKKEYEEYKKLLNGLQEKQNVKRLEVEEAREMGGEIVKNLLQAIEFKILDYIKSEKQLPKKDIRLYTLKINDQLMADNTGYQKIIVKEKIDSLFEENKKNFCSSCGANKPITDRPEFAKAKSALGYYMTDKVGFSSGLSGQFSKNFILCKDCYKELLVGETFVRNSFGSKIGGLNLYIIPKFLFSVAITPDKLSKWAEYIQSSFNSAKSITGFGQFTNRLEEYREFESSKNNFILNLLFYESGQRNIKILKLIKDVPPTRLETLRKTTNAIKDISDRLLGESNLWAIDLQSIYYLTPLKKTKKEKGFSIEYRKILDLYDAMFSEKSIFYVFLIKQFIELAQIYRFEKFSAYNIGKTQNPDIGLVHAVLKANLLLLYLKKLNLLEGGVNMNYAGLQFDDKMKDFLKEMGYDEAKSALFLLGYLIGEVGNVQYKKGSSKPILGKITFQGMNSGKLVRLVNEIFEKLVEYKKLPFNEVIFSEGKRLLDRCINSWPLSDQENVFYVLSGYAYATHQAIKDSSQKGAKEQEKREVKENERTN